LQRHSNWSVIKPLIELIPAIFDQPVALSERTVAGLLHSRVEAAIDDFRLRMAMAS